MTVKEAVEILKLERQGMKDNPTLIVESCLYEAFDIAIRELEKKIKPYERFEPCLCGNNKRQRWYCNGEHGAYIKLFCKKCGFSIDGKSEVDAKRKWNEYMRGNAK